MLFEKTGRAPEATTDKAGYWESYLRPGDDRTRLHNFFPARQILSGDGNPKVLASRQYLGRDDEAGPAVLITRKSDKDTLRALQRRYRPLLAIFDAHAVAVPNPGFGTPTLFYHESIFAPELTRRDAGQVVLCCLPDARFERFCAQADLRMIEPQESNNLTKTWKDVDGALQALIEKMDQRRDRVVVEVQRTASRLRNLLLSLPVGIEPYEQALLVSGQPESLWYDWSITQPLQALESRLPEMAALGEWEELILQELVDGFQRLAELLRQDSPKKGPLLTAINESVSKSRRVALVVTSQSVASGLRWVIRFPEPRGLGLSPDQVTAITVDKIKGLGPDQDCIIHEVFDPHKVFSELARVGPRWITFILLRNELRFVGERFLRSRQLFLNHLRAGCNSLFYNHQTRWHRPDGIRAFALLPEGERYINLLDELRHYGSKTRPDKRSKWFKDRYRKLIRDEPSWMIEAHIGKDTYHHLYPSRQGETEPPRAISVRKATLPQSIEPAVRYV